MRVNGLILAGGRARRMGYANKAEQLWRGQSLVSHCYQRLSPQVDAVWVSANRINDIDRWPTIVTVQPDLFRWRYQGPLVALEAGFSASRAEWLLVVPCDAPLFPVDLLARLLNGEAPHSTIHYAHDGQREQPLFALLHRDLHSALQRHLANPNASRRVLDFYREQGAIAVTMPDCREAFANINTFEQLRSGGAGHRVLLREELCE